METTVLRPADTHQKLTRIYITSNSTCSTSSGCRFTRNLFTALVFQSWFSACRESIENSPCTQTIQLSLPFENEIDDRKQNVRAKYAHVLIRPKGFRSDEYTHTASDFRLLIEFHVHIRISVEFPPENFNRFDTESVRRYHVVTYTNEPVRLIHAFGTRSRLTANNFILAKCVFLIFSKYTHTYVRRWMIAKTNTNHNFLPLSKRRTYRFAIKSIRHRVHTLCVATRVSAAIRRN